MPVRARGGVAVVVGTSLSLTCLLAAGPRWRELPSRRDDVLDWLRADPERAVGTGCALLGWLLVGWLCLGVAVSGLAVLPGAVGRLATPVARRVAPRVVRRAVEVAVGVTLAAVPGPALATTAGSAAPAGPAPVPVTDTGTRAPAAPGTPTGWPDLDRASTPPPAPPTAAAVTVRSGDTLWGIAGRALGPGAPAAAVADSWPRWYEANRTVVGPDPDLILPGQVLRPPAG
jgi:hypothetical protein